MSENSNIVSAPSFHLQSPSFYPSVSHCLNPTGFNRANDHWGKHLWAFLHTMTISDFNLPEANLRTQKPIVTNIKMLTNVIPCPECKAHFIQHLPTIDQIDLYKSNSLFYWTVDFHNKVNERLGKPVLSYIQAENIWCHKIDG